MDMTASGGIRADGHLTFNKEDGSPFLATFDATGNDSREEVLFQEQPVLLNMDALAGALLISVLTQGFFVAENWTGFMTVLGKAGVVALLIVYVSLWFFLIRLAVHRNKRYRYIPALEQFKRYFADQQWIALADDVLDPTDENYLELKKECVEQGFGLLLVDQNLKVHLIVTPARVQSARKKQRAELVFEDAQAWSLRMTERFQTGWLSTLPPWLDWLKKRAMPDFSLTRFKRSYTIQLLLMPACITATVFLINEVFKDPPLLYADESVYLRKLELLTQTDRRESGEYIIDSPFVEQFIKTPPTASPFEENAVSRDTGSLTPTDLIPGLGGPPEPQPKPKTERGKPSAVDAYDCDRFYGIRGPRYVVLYDMVQEEALAKRQLDTIYKAGIEGGLVWMGCFETGSSSFAVYMGIIFESMEEAASQKEKFQFVLEDEGVNKPLLRLRVLNFR
jgi:hypothetical protein